jgi:hypothetical protein
MSVGAVLERLPAAERLARRDAKIEGKVLLSTVPVFRYLRPHRAGNPCRCHSGEAAPGMTDV